MTTRPTTCQSRLRAGLSVAASLVIHAAVYGAAIAAPAWLIRQLPLEAPSLAGQRQLIHLQATWSISQPVTEPASVVIVDPVQVSPTEAVVEQNRLVATSAADMTLPVVDSPAAEIATPADLPPRRQEASDAQPPAAEAVPPSRERRPVSEPPHLTTSVAVLPQTAGTDATRPPRFAGNRPPNYPLVAQQQGWEGTVLLRLAIDERGQVTSVTVERSSGYEVLDAEAVAAIRLWRGEPATRSGQPVATEETLPVRFRLR
jgi:protein TonB